MKPRSNSFFIYAGIIACFLFVCLDLGLDIWFGHFIADYDWIRESISRLGEVGSPIQNSVRIWGISSTVLLLLFANAFRLVFPSDLLVRLGTLAICIYALGEGLGSGLFPIDQLNTPVTLYGTLHEVLSVIGDLGIVSLPFILLQIPYFQNNRRYRIYLKWVIVIGFLCIVLFLLGKYNVGSLSIFNYKGFWQRIYTFNYHLMLVVLSFQMIRIMRAQSKPNLI